MKLGEVSSEAVVPACLREAPDDSVDVLETAVRERNSQRHRPADDLLEIQRGLFGIELQIVTKQLGDCFFPAVAAHQQDVLPKRRRDLRRQCGLNEASHLRGRLQPRLRRARLCADRHRSETAAKRGARAPADGCPLAWGQCPLELTNAASLHVSTSWK